MDFRRLRAECTAVVNTLDIPAPFVLRTFCERLQEHRRRPIHLRPITFPPHSISGALVSTERVDYIFYESSTATTHQEHIILHEIGHMLWRHTGCDIWDEQDSRLVLPALDPKTVALIFARHHCVGIEERQAELVASLILRRGRRWSMEPEAATSTDDGESIKRIRRTLENGVGRPTRE
jgi:hypothetical protein